MQELNLLARSDKVDVSSSWWGQLLLTINTRPQKKDLKAYSAKLSLDYSELSKEILQGMYSLQYMLRL